MVPIPPEGRIHGLKLFARPLSGTTELLTRLFRKGDTPGRFRSLKFGFGNRQKAKKRPGGIGQGGGPIKPWHAEKKTIFGAEGAVFLGSHSSTGPKGQVVPLNSVS